MQRARHHLVPLFLALPLAAAGLLAATASADSSQVTIQNFNFQPGTVTIAQGTTVTWTNQDQVAHTATSKTGVWDSGNLTTGASYSFTFNQPGTYPYYCKIHPFMTGTIVVQASAPSPTSTTAPAPTPTTAPQPSPTSPPPPTATPRPALSVHVSLSPKTVHANQKLKITVRTLASARLTIKLSYKGARAKTMHGTANSSGTYNKTVRLSKNAKRSKLTVQVTASLGGQSARATAHANVR